MKNNRGFTVVELVIVIAVIAILAAVMIPTFSAIVKSANISADTQAVRNMNIILTSESADSPTPDDPATVIAILKENGITDFTPQTKSHKFFWLKDENVIILADEGDRPVYPEEYLGESLSASWKALGGDEAVTFPSATSKPNEEQDGQTFTVSVTQTGFASVTIPFKIDAKAKEGAEFRAKICLPKDYQTGAPIPRYRIKSITATMSDEQVVLHSANGSEALFDVTESALLEFQSVSGNIEINIEVVEYCVVTLKGENINTYINCVLRNDEGFIIGKSSIELILHEGYTVTSAIGTQNGKTLGELFVKEKNQIRSDTVSFMDGDVDIRVITEPKG